MSITKKTYHQAECNECEFIQAIYLSNRNEALQELRDLGWKWGKYTTRTYCSKECREKWMIES